MAVHKFYCLIHEEDNSFIVTFPDLENVFTQGDDLKEAIEMAEDVLGNMLAIMEEDGEDIPAPSPVKAIEVPEGASLILVEVNTDEYKELEGAN